MGDGGDRTGVTLLISLCFGYLLLFIPKNFVIRPGAATVPGDGGEEKETAPPRRFSLPEFLTGFWQNLEYVGFYLLLGVLLGSLVEVVVPASWFSYLFNRSRWFSVLAAAGLGVPLYACGGGVIPFIRTLLEQGMSKGAALTFFLVGPATRITPLMALAAVLRPLFIILYIIILVFLGSRPDWYIIK